MRFDCTYTNSLASCVWIRYYKFWFSFSLRHPPTSFQNYAPENKHLYGTKRSISVPIRDRHGDGDQGNPQRPQLVYGNPAMETDVTGFPLGWNKMVQDPGSLRKCCCTWLLWCSCTGLSLQQLTYSSSFESQSLVRTIFPFITISQIRGQAASNLLCVLAASTSSERCLSVARSTLESGWQAVPAKSTA